ncbi:sensor histidine kinase [Actinomadura kijaniata]|uniref:Anti-sigma regulatory factor (Ser/Thr protein kinase) n=1 Tax=Actinomadura namibiensis TaxID=182080 RepID=A0A7W3QMD9_ACTNM|nr:sensor histidine kinase [Actinomadura namibiensis]MBA8952406.1 anti-sigma regulatory factor (Ser/Thr protein kinase) [Actinomadura namibiensis]
MMTRSAPLTGAPFVHPALFYGNDDEYLAGTVPFLSAGLADGQPVAVAVPGRQLTLLRDALGADAVRVVWLDMTRAGRNPGRIIPGVLRAFADRHPRDRRVRIIGEPIWPGRSALEYPACVTHEALINLAFSGRRVSILCPYDTKGLPEPILEDARATHPTLLDRDGSHDSDAYAPERIVAAYNRPLPAPPADANRLRFDHDALPRVRQFARDHAAALGLSARRADDLELAVNELAANSIVHADGTGTLLVWAEGGQVVCAVRDTGTITDPLVGRIPAELATNGGRGLLMVNHIADLVRLHTGPEGTEVRVYLSS